MKAYFARLSPLERRFVVIVLVAVFVVLNLMFVTPRLSEWAKVKSRLADANRKQTMFDTEIAKLPSYESAIRTLEKDGAVVPSEDQSIDFLRNIQSQAALSGVRIVSNSKQNAGTNQFFVEQIWVLTVQSGEKELVDFLYSLGSGSSMIRARNFSLRPDPGRHQLAATVRLVASYQRKASGKSDVMPTKYPNPNVKKP